MLLSTASTSAEIDMQARGMHMTSNCNSPWRYVAWQWGAFCSLLWHGRACSAKPYVSATQCRAAAPSQKSSPGGRAVCWAKAGCGTAAAGQAQAAAAGSPASSPPAHASGAPTSPLGGRASSQSARRHAAANHTVNHARKQAAARTPAPCADGRGGGAPAAACGSAGDAAPGAAALAGSPPSFAGCGLGRRGGQADREAEAAAALGLRCKLGSGPGSTERSSGPFRNTIASGACRPLDVCTQVCAV